MKKETKEQHTFFVGFYLISKCLRINDRNKELIFFLTTYFYNLKQLG